MDYILPTEHEANAVLGMLYGDSLDVKPGDELPEQDAKYVGLFVDPENKPVAACICDTDFAAYAGSALTMLPPGGAEDAAETGELSQMMEENLYEVMNICSRMFMSDSTPHLKLELVHKYEDLPEDAKEVLLGAEGKRGLEIEVPRYGKGRLFMVTT